jgi:hypothetical protein
MEVRKITKRDAFSLFQSETPLFHDEEPSFTLFTGAKKARTVAAVVSKVHHGDEENKRRHRDKDTDSQNKERQTHSKFKFQIQIARKTHTR